VELTEPSKIKAMSHNLPVEITARPYVRSRILQLLSKPDANPNSKKRYSFFSVSAIFGKAPQPIRISDFGSGALALVTTVLLIAAFIKRWPKDVFYSTRITI
jgi:hypothetical protein